MALNDRNLKRAGNIIRWLTSLRSGRALRKERIKIFLVSHPELVSEEAIKDYAEIALKNDRLQAILTAVQLTLTGLLIANLFRVPIALTVYDLKIDSNLPIREALLIATSLVGLGMMFLQQTSQDNQDVLEQQAKAKYGPGYSIELARHRRLFGHWIRNEFEDHVRRSAFSISWLLIAAVSGILGAICLIGLNWAVQVIIIVTLWNHPSIPAPLNHLVVATALFFDLCVAAIFIADKVPTTSIKSV